MKEDTKKFFEIIKPYFPQHTIHMGGDTAWFPYAGMINAELTPADILQLVYEEGMKIGISTGEHNKIYEIRKALHIENND